MRLLRNLLVDLHQSNNGMGPEARTFALAAAALPGLVQIHGSE